MKRCVRCVMPDTKPNVVLDKEGVCQACRHNERKAKVDWDERFQELRKLCDKYRGINGDGYDSIVTVSGGKDSHYQVYVMKELMKMNPLLVNVDNFTWTRTGDHNFYNLSETFGCDILSLSLNRKVAKKLYRHFFERYGGPTWYWDTAVYAFPIKIAVDLGIQMITYGENVSVEYGGPQTEETYSAKEQIDNNIVPIKMEDWLVDGITMKDLNSCVYPSKEEIEKAELDPIYLSYFVNWDGYQNCKIAKQYGFKSLRDTGEWERQGYIEDYDQIDSKGYLVHPWMKYPKFGFARATDVGCYYIRSGRLTRQEALGLIEKHDRKLDPETIKDFLNFTGYTVTEFWEIIEHHINKNIWSKIGDHKWKLNDTETKQILEVPL